MPLVLSKLAIDLQAFYNEKVNYNIISHSDISILYYQ
jgi:hypothetical protein